MIGLEGRKNTKQTFEITSKETVKGEVVHIKGLKNRYNTLSNPVEYNPQVLAGEVRQVKDTRGCKTEKKNSVSLLICI